MKTIPEIKIVLGPPNSPREYEVAGFGELERWMLWNDVHYRAAYDERLRLRLRPEDRQIVLLGVMARLAAQLKEQAVERVSLGGEPMMFVISTEANDGKK